MVGLIVGYNADYLIGVDGQMPWRYKADMRRFRALTMGTTVVMGHRTWESLPGPLQGRHCVVLSHTLTPISRHPQGTCVWSQDLSEAIEKAGSKVWVIGGAEVYHQALAQDLVEYLDVTLVPDVVVPAEGASVVRFPSTFLSRFRLEQSLRNPEDPSLQHLFYRRISTGNLVSP